MDLKDFPMDHHKLQIGILFPDQNCFVQPNPSMNSFFRVSNISSKEFRLSQPAIEFGHHIEKEFSKDVRKLPQIKVSVNAHRGYEAYSFNVILLQMLSICSLCSLMMDHKSAPAGLAVSVVMLLVTLASNFYTKSLTP